MPMDILTFSIFASGVLGVPNLYILKIDLYDSSTSRILKPYSRVNKDNNPVIITPACCSQKIHVAYEILVQENH